MATRCCNGQSPPLLQQGPSFSSVASSPCCNGNHGNGTQGLDYSAMESKLPPVVPFSHKVVGEHEVSIQGQTWQVQRQQKRHRRRRVCLVVCLFVLNIAVSAGVCVLLLSFAGLPAANKANENQRTICIPCSPEDSKATSKDAASKDHLLCCSVSDGDDAQMRELMVEGIKQSLQERLKGEDLYNLLNNPLVPTPINRNAAHVFLKLARRQHVNEKRRTTTIAEDLDEDYESLREWSSEGNAAFIRQGITFNASSGHFKVMDPGIYVIYSRIVFEDDSKDDTEEEGDEDEEWPPMESRKMVFGHAISSYSYSGYRELLEDEQLSDCVRGGVVCYNSRIFSTLRLTKDATIAVRVRMSNFVSQRSRTSYFGLYKID